LVKFIYFPKIIYFQFISPKKAFMFKTSTYHIHITHNITVMHSCYHHFIIPVISKNSPSSSHFFILQNQIIFKIKPSYKLTYTFHNLSKIIITEIKSYPHHFILKKKTSFGKNPIFMPFFKAKFVTTHKINSIQFKWCSNRFMS
jgi:hypothetical protein